MYAISNLNESLALYLIDKNADVNITDKNLNTSLHLAADSENEYIVKKLLSAGANKMIRNNDDESPLDLAKYNEDDNMINLLK